MLRRLGELALDLLYPERCVGCGAFGRLLCSGCEATLPRVAGPRCPFCLGRWSGSRNCPRCYGWDALDGAVAVVDMEGVARRVVHGLKYQGVRGLAQVMAGHLSQGLAELEPDAVFAVPLHRSRERRRGFNQSDLILAALEARRGPGILARSRKTRSQVGMRQGDRRKNISGAFSYSGPPLAGLRVALVDDVITTGATANECARVLREGGARSVTAVAFARANFEPTAADAPIFD